MAKIASRFKVVSCPVCGTGIDCRVDKSTLVRHIKDEHPTVLISDLTHQLLRELKLKTPENINEVSSEELNEHLTNLCLYKATKSGLDDLRRKIQGK